MLTLKQYREQNGYYSLPNNYKKACVWNNKMARLLLGKPPKPTAQLFNFMPKGDIS
jgi:hypothetical protein